MVATMITKDALIRGTLPPVIMRAYFKGKLVAEQLDTKLTMRPDGDGAAWFTAVMEFDTETVVDHISTTTYDNVLKEKVYDSPFTMYPGYTIIMTQRIEITID